MATIKTYETSRGVRYCAEIVIRKDGRTLHRESKSFKRRTQAIQWSDRREAELKVNGLPKKGQDYTLAQLIESYMSDFGDKVRMGRTKQSDLNKIKTYEIASKIISTLTSADYIRHIKGRLDGGVLPQTAHNDIVWMHIVIKFGIAAFNLKADLHELEAAKSFLDANGMTARSARRERLPTAAEIRKLIEYFRDYKTRRSSVPMLDIMLFAIFSGRRQAEITRIRWEDNDPEHRTGIVRDLKHPRKKIGNHRQFNYPPEAWKIINKQPNDKPEIFPYSAKTVGTYFANACHVLEIKDLHFHDLRHLATSLLFIINGLPIQDVSSITLHESWDMLRRYTHLTEKQKAQVKACYQAMNLA